ncbi:MAG: hypothetical protein KBF84_15940, partial [Candidatus Microthrix sp.]|nr:hypothetical protein [Candidatus Microthrix sp.]
MARHPDHRARAAGPGAVEVGRRARWARYRTAAAAHRGETAPGRLEVAPGRLEAAAPARGTNRLARVRAPVRHPSDPSPPEPVAVLSSPAG